MLGIALLLSAVVGAGAGFQGVDPPTIAKSGKDRQLIINGPIKRAWDRYDARFLPWSDAAFASNVLKDCRKSCNKHNAPWAVIADVNGDGALDVLVDGFVKSEKSAELRTVLFLSDGLLHYRAIQVRSRMLFDEERARLEKDKPVWTYFLSMAPRRGEAPISVDINTPQSEDGEGGAMCNYALRGGAFEEDCQVP